MTDVRDDQSQMLSVNSEEEMQRLLFNPAAMQQLQSLANTMADSKVTVPTHLQGKPGDCMAICMQAAQWRMNPFSVAQKTHLTQGGQLGYEAQLVNAVVNSIAPIRTRIEFEFFGDWNKILGKVQERRSENSGGKYYVAAWNATDESGLGVKAWATLRGEAEPREITVMLSQCWPRFSTQWATDPQQQITYVAVKKWARRYCPDVILGVYTPDEFEPERDITPTHQPASAPQAEEEPEFISQDQIEELIRLALDAGKNEQYVCTKARVQSIGDIKRERFVPARNHLKSLIAQHASGSEEAAEASHG